MPNVRLPDGTLFPAMPGETPAQALEAARAKYPEAFDTRKPEEGFIPGVKAAGLEALAQYGLAASPIIGEDVARAAAERTKQQTAKIFKPIQYEGGDDSVKGALGKYGWINTTPGSEAPGGGVQLLKFWRDQLANMAPQVAATMAGSYAGAGLGSMVAPGAGTLVGGIGGALAANLPFQIGQNLQQQMEVQKEQGVQAPLEYGRAAAAGAPQAALDVAGQLLVLRRLGFSGKALDVLRGGTDAERAAAAAKKAAETLTKATAKGVGVGLATEVPTELAQQVLQRWQARQDVFGPDAMKDYEQTLVGTIGPAGLLGGAGGAHGRYSARKEDAAFKAAEAAKKAKADAEARRLADEAAIPGDQAKLGELDAQLKRFGSLLASKTLTKEQAAGVRKHVNGIKEQRGVLASSLKERGVEVPEPTVAGVVGQEMDPEALLAAKEAADIAAEKKRQEEAVAQQKKDYEAFLQQRFGLAEKESAGLEAYLERMATAREKAAQREAQAAAKARGYVVDDYGNRTKRQITDALGMQQGDDDGSNTYATTLDAFGREIPGTPLPALPDGSYGKGWENYAEEASKRVQEYGLKQQQERRAATGANESADQVEKTLRYSPLEYRAGKDPLSPAKTKALLTDIDSGIVNRGVQRALGIKGLGGTKHDLGNPEQRAAALKAIEARLEKLQGRKDALYSPDVELTDAAGVLTAAGQRAVHMEGQINELQRLKQVAEQRAKPDVGEQLIDTFASRYALAEGPTLDVEATTPEKHEARMHQLIEKQTKLFDQLRETLDDIRDESYKGGENEEEKSLHLGELEDRAQALKGQYIDAALLHAAHYRALKGMPPLKKAEAQQAANDMNEQLYTFIARSTVEPELITKPAQMRGTEVVKGAEEYWGYPRVQPYPDRLAVAGKTGFEEEGGFARGAGQGQLWRTGPPRALEKAAHPLRNLKHHLGPVQQKLSETISKLKQEKKGELVLRSTLLHRDLTGRVGAEKAHAELEKHLPRYRAFVAGRIENLMDRVKLPAQAHDVLTSALDMLDDGRGPRPLIQDIETLVGKYEIGSQDPDLLNEVRDGIEADEEAKGTEGKTPAEKTSLEKQPDLFEAEPRINQSVRGAEQRLKDATQALDDFRKQNKGKKLDLAKFRDLLKERELAETQHLMMLREQEREGSPFIRQGTNAAGEEIARGAEMRPTAKKFMSFLNSPAVRKLKDYFTPGWRALNKAKAEQKKISSRQEQIDRIDDEIARVEGDYKWFEMGAYSDEHETIHVPRGVSAKLYLKDIDRFRHLVLPENPTPADIHQYMTRYGDLVQTTRERRDAYNARMKELTDKRKALVRESYLTNAQQAGKPVRRPEQAAVEKQTEALFEAISDAYDGILSRRLDERLQNDKDVQQLRAQVKEIRETIGELRKQPSPTHQWAAEADKQLKDQIGELERIAAKYQDELYAFQKSIEHSIDEETAKADARVSASVKLHEARLNKAQEALDSVSSMVETKFRIPIDVVRRPTETSVQINLERIEGAQLKVKLLQASLKQAEEIHKRNPSPRMERAVQRAKDAVKAAEQFVAGLLGSADLDTARYVATKGVTFMTDRVNAEKTEIQKQRVALAAAKREAQKKRDKLSAERAAFEQRLLELNNERRVTTRTVEPVRTGEAEEYVVKNRHSLRAAEARRRAATLEEEAKEAETEEEKAAALRGAEKAKEEAAKAKALAAEHTAALAELSAQKKALERRKAELSEGSPEYREVVRRLIANANKRREAKAGVEQVVTAPQVSVKEKALPALEETLEERVERKRAAQEAAREERESRKRFAFETAPKSKTMKAQAAAAKTLKYKGDQPARVNPKGKLRTATLSEAAFTPKQRREQTDLQREIEGRRPVEILESRVDRKWVKGKGWVVNDKKARFSQAPAGEPTGNTAAGITSRLKKEFASDAGFSRLTRVVQTEEELPAEVRNHPGYKPGTRGVAHKGKVWLVADNIAHGDELGVFLHEAGAHLGFDKIMQPNDRLWLARRVVEWAGEEGVAGDAARAALERAGDQNADEVVAYMTEELVNRGVKPTEKTKEGNWLKRVLDAFQRALNLLFNRPTKFTPQQLVDMAYGAAKIEMEYGTTNVKAPETRFSNTAKYASGYDPTLVATTDKIVAKDKTLGERLSSFVAGFHQNVVDSQGPYHTLLMRAVKSGLTSIKSAVQTSYFMRQAQRGHYWVAHALSDGNVQLFKNKDGDWEIGGTDNASAKAIIDALKPLIGQIGDAQAVYKEYTAWRAAKRAEIIGKDKLNFGEDVTEADLARQRREGDARPEFKQASDAHDAFNKGLIDFAVQSGAMPKAIGDKLNAQKYYIPYYREGNNHDLRVMLDAGESIPIGSIKNSPYLHELVGGETKILPFEDSIQQNASLLIGMGLQNLAARNAAFELQRLGLAFVHNSGTKTGPDVIHFNIEPENEKDDGKRSAVVGDGARNEQVERLEKQLGRIPPNTRAFEIVRGKLDRARAATGQFDDISGELLVKSMEGLSTSLPTILRMMSGPANLLRRGVTRNPIYAARQMIRDPWAAYFATGANINPFTTAVKEVYKIYSGKDEDYREAQHRGMIGGQVFNGTEDDVKKLMRMHMEGGGLGTLWTTLDKLAMRSDGATRVALMKDFEEQGLSRLEATMAVNASMDFTRRGASASVHWLSMMIPFFNAQIQGMDVVYKALSGQMTAGEKTHAYAKLAKRASLMVGMSILYAAMMKDDEAYKNASPLVRLNNFFVRVPGLEQPIKIPIPFEFGFLFKSVPETLVLAAQKDQKVKPLLDAVGQAAVNMIPGGNLLPIPQAVKPAYEAYFNKVSYSGLPITSDRLAQLDPQYRVNPTTTEFAKAAGGQLGKVPGLGEYLSPVMIDHFINGYLGGLGTNATALASIAMPWSVIRNETSGPVTKKMNEVPFVGQAFQTNTGNGLVSQAYEMAKQMEKAKATYEALVEKGDVEGVKEYAEANKGRLARADMAKQFMRREAEYSKMENAVRNAPKGRMTPEEKMEVIEKIKRAKIKRAEQFVSAAG